VRGRTAGLGRRFAPVCLATHSPTRPGGCRAVRSVTGPVAFRERFAQGTCQDLGVGILWASDRRAIRERYRRSVLRPSQRRAVSLKPTSGYSDLDASRHGVVSQFAPLVSRPSAPWRRHRRGDRLAPERLSAAGHRWSRRSLSNRPDRFLTATARLGTVPRLSSHCRLESGTPRFPHPPTGIPAGRHRWCRGPGRSSTPAVPYRDWVHS